MKRLIMLLALVSLLVLACKKDSDPEPVPVITKTDLLTKNNGWIITAATISPGSVIGSASYTDFYSLLDNCQKDDKLCTV